MTSPNPNVVNAAIRNCNLNVTNCVGTRSYALADTTSTLYSNSNSTLPICINTSEQNANIGYVYQIPYTPYVVNAI